MIDVLLVDDEPLVRSGLRALLAGEPGLRVVGEAGDGADVPDAVGRLRPDVVIMDVRMPGIDGVEATRRLVSTGPSAPKILVLTTFENDDYVYDALRAGADGFLLKRAPTEEIVRAVRTVAAGEALLFPAAIRRLASTSRMAGQRRMADAGLTEREQDVLRLVAAGHSNAEIARELFVGVETVKTHVASLLAKLGVRDRTQAVIAAYESGFVGPSSG
jgi:DNA-binding NarL/FixJ family response regulator